MNAEAEIEIDEVISAVAEPQIVEAIKRDVRRAQDAVIRTRKNARPIIDAARTNEIREKIYGLTAGALRAASDAAEAAAAKAAKAAAADDSKAAEAALKEADDACVRVNAAVKDIAKLCKDLRRLGP